MWYGVSCRWCVVLNLCGTVCRVDGAHQRDDRCDEDCEGAGESQVQAVGATQARPLQGRPRSGGS